MPVMTVLIAFAFIVVAAVADAYNGQTGLIRCSVNSAFMWQKCIQSDSAGQQGGKRLRQRAAFSHHHFWGNILYQFPTRTVLCKKRATAQSIRSGNTLISLYSNVLLPSISFDRKFRFCRSLRLMSANEATWEYNDNQTLANGTVTSLKSIENIYFEEFLELLKRYKWAYNSTSIPEEFRITEDQNLWNSQFHGFPLGRLYWRMQKEHLFIYKNITRKQQIEECGFSISPLHAQQNAEHIFSSRHPRTRLKQQADFEKLITGAKIYKTLYKTLNVPYRYKIPNSLPFPKETWGFNLGVALHGVKRAKKYLNLPGSREALEALGVFSQQETLTELSSKATTATTSSIDQEWEMMASNAAAFTSTPTTDTSEEIFNKESLRENLATMEPFKFEEFESISDTMSPREKEEMLRELLSSNITEVLLSRSDPRNLIQRPTRLETEGGYHYEFDIWSFEDVLKAMQAYNNLYLGHLEENESISSRAQVLKNQGFNILEKSWSIPDENSGFWPKEWAGMPLGKYLHAFRVGDIDAKNNWKRRVLLDNIGFDWGDGYAYLNFTWKKLFKGLIWWMYFRGHPFCDLEPHSVIPVGSLVGDFAKPEEVHGLQLGYLIRKAWSQEPVLWHHFPQRYEFLRSIGLTWMRADQLISEYKLEPNFALPRVPKEMLSEELEL
ncbi:hypothetical protein IE077_004001 [Cardiosporidium cionae]|uniref:Uncharacterized protein n=1 Tax=Cardiosporidium cionae TaxID=476202 RepID=A0ABQ7JEJ2_9APIC|nr:hypothetical protein IE077_004001 [Cardiosporidium cionae]|eukprot:KAF8822315.1 hypothetical protein IE077_004001 [Cardiosporidium cionae]